MLCQQTHLHLKRVSRCHGRSLADTHTWQKTRYTLTHTEQASHAPLIWVRPRGGCCEQIASSEHVAETVTDSGREGKPIQEGSGVDTESVISGFFVGGHVGVKSERECGGEKKKRWMWTEADNRETEQNAALAGAESQQFAAP